MTSQSSRQHFFVAVLGDLGGKGAFVGDVLSSHEQQIYPAILLDENSIEFECQTDCNYYDDLKHLYLAPKLKLVKGCGDYRYTVKEVQKEHKAEKMTGADAKDDCADDENTESITFVAYVSNIMPSVLSNVRVYINNH